MLRRKTIIVLTITFMVTLMVSAFSYLYISQVLRLRLDNANETAKQLTRQLAYAAENDPPDFSSTAIDTNDPRLGEAGLDRVSADRHRPRTTCCNPPAVAGSSSWTPPSSAPTARLCSTPTPTWWEKSSPRGLISSESSKLASESNFA